MSGWDEGAVYYSDQALAGDDGAGARGEAGTDSNHSLLQKFKEFIRNFETANNVFPYRESLLHNPKFLLVDMGDLDTFDSDLPAKLRSSPADILPLFETAAAQVLVSLKTKVAGDTGAMEDPIPGDVQILLTSKEDPLSMRSLGAQYISKLVKISGITIAASRTKAKATYVTLICKNCKKGKQVPCRPGLGGAIVPRSCDHVPQPGEEPCPIDPWLVVPDKSKYVDQQTLKLQENPEDVPTGELPRNLLLSVDRHLVQTVVPGSRLTIMGIYSVYQASNASSSHKGAVAVRQPYIRVVGIEETNDTQSRGPAAFTQDEIEEFKKFAAEPDAYKNICSKIAPSIFGHDDVKKAVACLLFGGSRKHLPDGVRLRGDINVLLLGDPSTAKSQFLKFVEKTAPIAVYTSGKGSSAAGLTASVIRDSSTREFYLEGGAMVLADGGVVCIDEFDKMRPEDRVAIHEAMEQQTISIAKAGITTVLNSRTSVLAAANPPSGRYDDLKTAQDNIDLQTTILSRFDLIFIVKDVRMYSQDKIIANHIIKVHASAGRAGALMGESKPSKEENWLKRYLQYCRNECHPRLSESATALLQNHYVKIRQDMRQQANETGEAAAIPITVRQLEAIVRLSIMDSVVNAAVEEICGGIEDGVTLAGLWEKLQGSPSFSSTNLNLNRNVKRALWTNLLRIPVLRFEPPPSSSELEDAENLNLKVFPQSSLVHNFLGLYESQSIQHAQTRVLHLLAKARRNGITQTRLAKRLNIDANKFHYVLRSLECRGLIVKRSAIERKKRISSFGESENYSSVTTNLVFLRCYAKHLADGTTFQTDVHLKDDYSPQMKAVCDKLAKAKGKVLLVSDIRKDLGYCGFRPKRRAWNQITQRLNADGIVEQFFAKVNGKIETCLQLLDPITAGSGNEDKKLNSGKTCQVIDQLVELPTEHQIFDIIDAAGSCGITLKEICERLGIELKKSTIPFVDFCGRFKMIVREEQCLKSKTYRVWSSNFKLEPEIELKPELVASTASEELAGHANFSLSVDDTQRANRILERLKDERFILKPELNRWLSSFEKDKPTKVDPNTIDGILSILKKQVLVKCIKVYSPVIFEYLSTKVCVVVRPSTSLSPELFDEIEDRIRTFLPRKSTSHQKNDELILVMEDIQKNQSVIVPDGQVLSMYSCKRRRHFVSQFKDEEKQDNSPEGMGDSSCRRKNKFTELRPAKHARIDALTDVVDMHIEQSHNLDVQSGDCATGMEEFEGSTPEDCTPLINQGVLKKMKPTRRRRFSWSNKTERQLVIQYVKHRAVLGAKSRVYWKSISDLPTSPTACMERMTLLNGNLRFRTAVNKLCNILSERYAKHLQKYQNMSLNSDECKQFVRSQPYEGISNNSPDVEIQTRSLNREAWDDFENKTIKTALEEILRCKIIAKLDASSQKGQMQYEGCSDASLNADGYESQENAEITSAIPCEIVRSHRGKAHSLSSQRSRRQRLDKKFTGFLKNMANVYGQVNESLAISNAVELFKLVFLSTSTGPQPPNLLADILHRYSEHDLFAAFNYLREKKIMVGGTGSERFELSQQFLQSVSKSPFPFNTGKQAVKFAAWLKERGEDLTEGGAKISEDLKCGDIFHLFALVSSGDILILPSLPDNGVGEAEDLRSAKRKFDAIESSYGDKAKKSKSLFGVEGEIISRREKGFPGIAISAYQTTISKADILNFFKDNDNNGQPFRGHLQLNIGQSCDYFLCDYMLEIVKSCDPKPLEENHTESPWEAMAGYARRLLLEYSNQEHGYGICAEVFKVVYAAIQKAGDQGLSMGEISKIINLPGAKVDGLIVDALQAFGKTLKVNAYDTVCVVDVLYRHKYFLPSHFRHDVQPSSRKTIEKSDLTCEHYESDKRDTSSVHTLSDRKITIDNAEGVTINQACDRNESCKQDRLGLCRVNHQKETLKFSLGESCMPILPWINGNGTINNIVYRGLRRRVLGIVMQNPGMLEDDILRHMHVLNPQSCRTLLEMMVLDKHLVVRKMHQNIFDGGPTVLQYLIGSKSSQPKLICREHFFPNPMSTALL